MEDNYQEDWLCQNTEEEHRRKENNKKRTQDLLCMFHTWITSITRRIIILLEQHEGCSVLTLNYYRAKHIEAIAEAIFTPVWECPSNVICLMQECMIMAEQIKKDIITIKRQQELKGYLQFLIDQIPKDIKIINEQMLLRRKR